MPTHPPRNNATKKREILERRVFECVQLHNIDKESEKQLKVAEKVRQAQLNYLKARISASKTFSSETQPDSVLMEKIKMDIAEWEKIQNEEIITYCLLQSR